MKQIIVHAGFHPETPREYHGEHIYKIVENACVFKKRRSGDKRIEQMDIFDKRKIGFICRLAKGIVEQDFTPIYEKDFSTF